MFYASAFWPSKIFEISMVYYTVGNKKKDEKIRVIDNFLSSLVN